MNTVESKSSENVVVGVVKTNDKVNIEEMETEPLILSQFPDFMGPVTSTQVDSDAVILDTEDVLEYRARSAPVHELRKVKCRECESSYQLEELDPYCPHCGMRA